MRWIALTLIVTLLAGCATNTPDGEPAPGFAGGGNWLQSEPLTLDDLDGNVVLVDFWTYSCVNCLRTLPHLTAWYDTYAPLGFVIIGVHTPEFAFEEDADNVLAAMEELGVHYPVVQDNDKNIWRAWDQRYWPAKYLLDGDGVEVYHHFGEGAYYETESRIRDLLLDQGKTLPPRVESADGGTPNVPVTRELYAGTWRQADALGDPQSYQNGQTVTYELPEDRARDHIYLEGDWFNGHEALVADGPGTVVLPFRAAAANFVVDGEGCVEVSLGGEAVPGWGPDVDAASQICLDGARSYDFYAGPWAVHEVRFDVPDGFELYTFAFSRDVEEDPRA